MPAPLNIPVLKVEGQGLSKKQQLDLKRMEKDALAWTSANSRRYEDPDFPAGPEALGPELAQQVVSWRRPSEFVSDPLLFKNFWEIEGVKPGTALDDRWFLGAVNIIAGNRDSIDRMFLSSVKDENAREPMLALAQQGADHGFYIVRFYEDDPHSDDDWQCVLVDDRIPCGADGKPLFATCPDEHVFWVMIVEKAYAKYVGGYHKIGQREVEYGLELLAGGIAHDPLDLTTPLGQSMIPGGDTPNKLWDEILEKISSNHAIGAEFTGRPDPAGPELPFKEMQGLQRDHPYCMLVANEVRQAGKLIRMRTFRGDSEWRGKWSDDSEYWTNKLRQMLSYSADGDDGSFWMEYEDFVEYFNRVWFVRMADDRWTRFTVRSQWADRTAGGSMAYCSWIHNYQWRLRVPPKGKPARVILTVSVPEKPVATSTPGAPVQYPHAIGLDVLRGNKGDDKKRQRLRLDSADDLVYRIEPRFRRKVVAEVFLEPDDTPYILRPFCANPGRESEFQLVVLSDDKDDDGVPDFEFSFIDEADNWKHTWLTDEWDAQTAGGPLSGPTWDLGPQFQLEVKEQRTRVFLALELVDVDRDGRDEAGIQDLDSVFEQVQVAVCEGKGKNVRLTDQPKVLYMATSKQPYPDGCILEIPMDGLPRSETPYIVIPFTTNPGVKHKFAISCYTNYHHEFSKVNPEPCNLCPGDCKTCPMVQIMQRLDLLETKFDNHLSFLEQL
mmetsp:Transcript_15023/g.46005  ORF Transcript_15023/g.46005 Transcript_15023/m.46005 type:complete len:722 (-) Transcript_15023:347-2512(-)